MTTEKTTDLHPEPATSTGSTSTAAKVGRPPKRRRVNQGGSITRLDSGKWRVRYYGDDGKRRSRSFATKRDAADFLATTRADLLRGAWQAPEAGAVPLSEYAADWLDGRHDLRPTTRALYADLLARWINQPLDLHPTPGLGQRRTTVHLGARHLRNLTQSDIRQWHAAIVQTVGRNVAEREAKRRASVTDFDAAACRAWARANGYAVADAGRLPVAVMDAYRAAGSPTRARHLDPPAVPPGTSQAQKAYAVVRSILNAAVAEGHMLANPCHIPGAGTARAARRVYCPTPEDVARLAEAMPERLRVAVTLAAYSGLRGGELFALARRHVDLDAGTLRVERTIIEVTGEPITFGPPKTDAGYRTVHLGPELTKIVAEHLRAHVARGLDALLFASSTGRALPASRRAELMGRARRATGLDAVTWHSLRHTGATLYAQAGASLADLQARIGHSTVAAAMTYQHASASRDQALAAVLDQHLHPVADPDPEPDPLEPTGSNVTPLTRPARRPAAPRARHA